MCMFSARRGILGRLGAAPVRVSETRIFARCEGAIQSLAYSMHLRARSELAMVLPLPVVIGAGEDAVEFVDLSEAPQLFVQLARLFEMELLALPKGGMSRLAPQSARLVVHSVGAFEASFVPRVRDFARLDPRFRLPDAVWSALPRYADWGFAVFKLKRGDHRVHPMGLRFPSRNPARLFFPTVHVHDGEVHPQADFDHELYWQGERGAPSDERSDGPASALMEQQSRGVVRAEPVCRRILRGRFDNDDVWV